MMKNVKSVIKSGVVEERYTGAAIKIVYFGEVLYEDYFGNINPQKPKKVNAETYFDIASLTKIFITTIYLKLVEKKKLDIDEQISKYIPEFSTGVKSRIKFRHLLSHSSGLPASFNLYHNHEWTKGKEFVISKIINTNLVYDPGYKLLYSCLGYILLGYLLEKIVGKSLDTILNEYLFRPYDFENISYVPSSSTSNICITTYTRPNRGELKPGIVHDGNAIAINNGISGNAGLFANLSSVSKLGELFLSRTFLPENLYLDMISEQARNETDVRGIGWVLYPHNINESTSPGRVFSNRSFGHTGFTGTSLWIDPVKNLSVTFLTNSVHYYTNNKESAQEFNQFRYKLHQLIIENLF